jgi:hypothetical protein
MLRILSLIISVVLVIYGILLLTGYRTPQSYSNSLTYQLDYSSPMVWQELLKIKEIPNRKRDVVSIEILEEFGKLTAWKENTKGGGYRVYRMNKREENKQFVIELTESSYGLTGIWTFDLEKSGNSTLVTISETSTLTDITRRGFRSFTGRDVDIIAWQKYLKAGLVQALLITP